MVWGGGLFSASGGKTPLGDFGSHGVARGQPSALVGMGGSRRKDHDSEFVGRINRRRGRFRGRWHFNISTPKAGGPHEVRIAGTNEHVVKDVMVGEVWLCSGQSNMEWSGRQQLPQSLEEGPLAVLPEMRFFEIPKTTSQHPQDQCEGRWKVCSPETMPSFSAVGYFLGNDSINDCRCRLA